MITEERVADVLESERTLRTRRARRARCPYCHDRIDEPEVVCGRCGTAHHKTCWGLYGGCSIHGCGSSRRPAARPRTERPPGLAHRALATAGECAGLLASPIGFALGMGTLLIAALYC